MLMLIFYGILLSLAVGRVLVTPDEKGLCECDYFKIDITDECPKTSMGFDWEVLGEELYKVRALTFAGSRGREHRIRQLSAILNTATTPFHLGFECPLATASLYWSLAQDMAAEGRMRRAQALLLMGFIFTRDKGFNECTPWPVQGWDMLLSALHARQYVESAEAPSQLPDVPTYRDGTSKIAIVSICGYAANETVRVLSEENHALYAQLHGYALYQFGGPEDIYPNMNANMSIEGRKPFFWKVNAVRNVMDLEGSERPDWVMWMDCDAFYMDPERSIDSVIRMYAYNTSHPTEKGVEELKVHQGDSEIAQALKWTLYPDLQVGGETLEGGPEVELLIAVDSTGINNGVWMIRNSEWSKNFLSRWWNSGILEGAGKDHNCSDQSTMQHELLYDGSTRQLLDYEGARGWDRLDGPMWPREVRVVRQEYMQSFHEATAQSVLSREYQDGDFIRHHPGCHYYKLPCQVEGSMLPRDGSCRAVGDSVAMTISLERSYAGSSQWLYAEASDIFKEKLQRLITSHVSHKHGGIALVVGCGDGIGRAIIERLAEDPGIATVVAVRRNRAKLDELLGQIGNHKIHGLPADARLEEEVVRLFDVGRGTETERRFGPITLCVHNIGANVSFTVEETTARVYRKVWEMACLSAFYTARECAKRMGQRGEGTLVITSATASVRGKAGYSAFAGALHAKRALAQSLTCELGPKGVHVAHVVVDGPVDTPWVRCQLASEDDIAKLIPPRTIAETIVFLHNQTPGGWSNEVDLRGASMSPWWS
ncbi:hypothetical protein FOZ63_023868 [Perkinsus olseni]|uniref:Uncharacterized protein n=1 Tax=Perkinsus olseni TaxID=32597 RepID=A0A7J6TXN9_PEROL|nr:hypothetical protein FOZ63_023868 [Perkinsus olseni]